MPGDSATARDASVVAVVQARLASSRLPAKALQDFAGKPMVLHIVDRVRYASTVNLVGVATTSEPSDDPLVEVCEQAAVPIHRGPVTDILGRLVGAARALRADILVRVWGDAPFIDPHIVDSAVNRLLHDDLEFVTSGLLRTRTYPEGMDVEVYTRQLLERMDSVTIDRDIREFPVEVVKLSNARIGQINYEFDLRNIHLTVDYPADLEAARRLYNFLEAEGRLYDFAFLVELTRMHPDITTTLSHGPRNADYTDYIATMVES